MKKLTLTRIMKGGIFDFYFEYDGIEYNGQNDNEAGKLSRILTNTTNEESCGIFTALVERISFAYGKVTKVIKFERLLKYGEPNDTILSIIIERIEQVRKWVKSVDFEETSSVHISDSEDEEDNCDWEIKRGV